MCHQTVQRVLKIAWEGRQNLDRGRAKTQRDAENLIEPETPVRARSKDSVLDDVG
jgi:hypothetical protein